MKFKNCKLLFIAIASVALLSCAKGGTYTYGYYTGKQRPASHAPSSKTKVPVVHPADYHRVEKGETLYSIAWAYGHDVRDVASWNNIRPPYTIYPEQQIRVKPLPKQAKRSIVRTKPSSKTRVERKNNNVTQPVIYKDNRTRKETKISWQWPTKGKIIGKYSARDAGKKGLDIAGNAGQHIFASAGGEVVYVGSGLRGYGKLIIIKHNETYFSAYAHNRRLFVKENQKVKRGQHIANMGSSEAQQPMLHFEVRRNGKPVDPMNYLPRRR